LPGLRAARLALAGARGPERWVVSGVRAAQRRAPVRAWLELRLLRRAVAVTASGPAEAERWRRFGLAADRVVVIPPAVEPAAGPPGDRAEVCRPLGLPETARLIVGVGPLEPHKGFRDAIWGFDILKHVYRNLHLLLVGRGSAEAALDAFATALGGKE